MFIPLLRPGGVRNAPHKQKSGYVMSQRDGFSGGFLLGTLVGGIVGGVVGALLTAKQFTTEAEAPDPDAEPTKQPLPPKRKRKVLKAAEGDDMETARRSLEDKIAQLNSAIDDVRQQLGSENGTPTKPGNPPSPPHRSSPGGSV